MNDNEEMIAITLLDLIIILIILILPYLTMTFAALDKIPFLMAKKVGLLCIGAFFFWEYSKTSSKGALFVGALNIIGIFLA